jgi:hypothetical protein
MGRREDGAVIVGVGGVCVVVEAGALDARGRWMVAATAPAVEPAYRVLEEPGVVAADEAMPDGMLTTEHVEAILRWEVGFVEGVAGDAERPGLGAEAELYLRFRPDTGDSYLKDIAPQADPIFERRGADGLVLDLAELPPSGGPGAQESDEAGRESGDALEATASGGDDDVVTDFALADYDDPADYDDLPLLHQFCASMAYVEDLSGDEIVAAAAQDLIDRISYAATAVEFYPVLAEAVETGALPDEIVELTDGFDAESILDFLTRLVTELDRRRPWPDPALVAVDPEQWPTMGSSRPIGWVDMDIDEVEWAVKESFGDIPEDDLPLLILRMRGGQLVALVGQDDPDPERFLVLLPDVDGQWDPADVMDYLARYAGLEVETDGLADLLEEASGP